MYTHIKYMDTYVHKTHMYNIHLRTYIYIYIQKKERKKEKQTQCNREMKV